MLRDLQRYFHEILNVSITVRPWVKKSELPLFLIVAYDFYEISLLNNPCLLMLSKSDTVYTPALIRNHWEQVQKMWGEPIIYVQSAISSYNRKRLIEHQVPFIVPGNQMYLPQLGIDLREHFRRMVTKNEFFSPAAQTVVIYALVRETSEPLSPSTLAQKLGYTLMTIGRAFRELEGAGIGEISRTGRNLRWAFSSKKDLWGQAKPFLRNPVKKHVWVKDIHPVVVAGLSALSRFSMIGPPTLPVCAVGIDRWKEQKRMGVEELPTPEEANFEVEIWLYNPELFAKDDVSDPFSVYLRLREVDDERVEGALEEMMEKITW